MWLESQVVARADSHEWLAARKTGIGASEIAAAAGVSNYRTPLEIYCIKRGLQSEPTDDIDAIRLGKLLEPVVKAEFVRRTGLSLAHETCPMLRHLDFPELIATPDAMVCDGAVLECKTTNWRTAKNLGDEDTDDLPFDWLCQTQSQMCIADTQNAHVAVLVDGRNLKLFRVQRSDRLIEELNSRARALWRCIVDGTPPKGDAAHASTAGLLKNLYSGVTAESVIELPQSIGDLWIRSEELGKEIAFLKKEQERIDNQIRLEMKDAAVARIPGFDFELTRKVVNVKAHQRKATSYVKLDSRKVANVNGD